MRELFQPDPASSVAGFFENRGIAESAQRDITCLAPVHTCRNVFGDLLLEMELDFVV
jgi:hypothetical protein